MSRRRTSGMVIFLLSILTVVTGALTINRPSDPTGPGDAYLQRIDLLAGQDGADRVYFLGDSHVFLLDTSSLLPGSLNMGVSGDRATWLSARIENYRFLAEARCVVLAIGINDLAAGIAPADVSEAAVGSVEDLPASIPIILSAILPVEQNASLGPGQLQNGDIDRANTALEAWCRFRRNCLFANAAPEMKTPANELDAHLHRDGVHLTDAGYELWRRTLGAALETAGCADG